MARIRREKFINCDVTFDELEELAMQGVELPNGLDLINAAAFLALRNIYAAYYKRRITQAQAKKEKQQIYTRYIKQRENDKFFRSMVVRRIENGISAQAKEKEILFKLKDGLQVEREAIECIGLLLGDACFTATALARIKEREICGEQNQPSARRN